MDGAGNISAWGDASVLVLDSNPRSRCGTTALGARSLFRSADGVLPKSLLVEMTGFGDSGVGVAAALGRESCWMTRVCSASGKFA